MTGEDGEGRKQGGVGVICPASGKLSKDCIEPRRMKVLDLYVLLSGADTAWAVRNECIRTLIGSSHRPV